MFSKLRPLMPMTVVAPTPLHKQRQKPTQGCHVHGLTTALGRKNTIQDVPQGDALRRLDVEEEGTVDVDIVGAHICIPLERIYLLAIVGVARVPRRH